MGPSSGVLAASWDLARAQSPQAPTRQTSAVCTNHTPKPNPIARGLSVSTPYSQVGSSMKYQNEPTLPGELGIIIPTTRQHIMV